MSLQRERDDMLAERQSLYGFDLHQVFLECVDLRERIAMLEAGAPMPEPERGQIGMFV